MLAGAKYIIELFDNDEFKPFLIQGPHRWGKSNYGNILMSEVFSIHNGGIPNWEKVKKRIGYTPEEVLDQLDSIEKDERWYCFHWDDAGTWLHSLDFQDQYEQPAYTYLLV